MFLILSQKLRVHFFSFVFVFVISISAHVPICESYADKTHKFVVATQEHRSMDSATPYNQQSSDHLYKPHLCDIRLWYYWAHRSNESCKCEDSRWAQPPLQHSALRTPARTYSSELLPTLCRFVAYCTNIEILIWCRETMRFHYVTFAKTPRKLLSQKPPANSEIKQTLGFSYLCGTAQFTKDKRWHCLLAV